MKINRLELLGLLKVLRPAIASSRNQLPELAHVWFSGTHASAFDDVLGIRVAFPTEFTGGILGDKLIGVIERSRAKDVDVTVSGEDALLKIGAARIKLTRRPIEDWFWQPEVPDDPGYVVKAPFREALDLSLISVGSSNVLNPEQRGVTVVQNGKAADLYSTDAVSMSWTHLQTGEDRVLTSGGRVILPTPFCEQVRGLKQDAELRFDENAVYCLTGVDLTGLSGRKLEEGEKRTTCDALIFSKLVEDDDQVSFEDVVKQHVTDDPGVEIPSQLKLRAERAMVLLGDQPVEMEVEDNRLFLYAQTPYGEVDDVVKFGDHPNIKVKLDVALLHRVLDGRERMRVSKEAVVVTGPEAYTHIIATK